MWQRIPIYFWVLDLWPESLQSAGGITNKYVLGFFTEITKLMYNQSRKILISSKGFRKSILDKGTYDNKLVYFPNWAEDIFTQQVSVNIPTLPTGFKVMFAGNIGEAQDFEHVMQAAVNLKNDKEIKFILVGDGRKKAWVDDFIHKKQLQDTVFTLGRFPIESMPAFFRKANVMLLSLKDNDIFSLTVPAKLQTYMAASKPVVAMINGEARNLIAESDCGLSCPAGDSDGLATNIRLLKSKTLAELDLLGKNGYAYYQKHFTKDTCITHLCEIIENKA